MRRPSVVLFLSLLLAASACTGDDATGPSLADGGPALTLEEGQCEWAGIYPECTSPPGTSVECPALDPYCSGGPDTGGGGDDPGGGGGDPGDSDDPNAGEPCETGDAALDSENVQEGLDSIWAKSKPDAPMEERQEHGGWIIKQFNGTYAFQEFPSTWSNGPCGIDPPQDSRPPMNTVAWVHTHPYAYGEKLTACEGSTIIIGGQTLTGYNTYLNDPSPADGKIASHWGKPGYVIDEEKITKFVGNLSDPNKVTIVSRETRCGY